MFKNFPRYISLFYFLCSFNYGDNLDNLDNCVSFQTSLDRETYYPDENLFLEFNIDIEKGFHIYSVHPNKSLAPTYIEIIDTVYFSTFGVINEPTPKKKCDATFNEYVSYHEDNIILIQPLRIQKKLNPGNYKVNGMFQYYACDATMCIPKSEEFSFNLNVDKGNSRLKLSNDFSTEYEFQEIESCEESFLDKEINKGLISFIIFSIGMGFIALLTPFP